jgi:hypothetical protein
MTKHPSRVSLALLIGLLAGVGTPLLDVRLNCRVPDSEGCVWGKAYLPLSLSISVLVIGGIVFLLAYGVLVWRSSRGKDKDNR